MTIKDALKTLGCNDLRTITFNKLEEKYYLTYRYDRRYNNALKTKEIVQAYNILLKYMQDNLDIYTQPYIPENWECMSLDIEKSYLNHAINNLNKYDVKQSFYYGERGVLINDALLIIDISNNVEKNMFYIGKKILRQKDDPELYDLINTLFQLCRKKIKEQQVINQSAIQQTEQTRS